MKQYLCLFILCGMIASTAQPLGSEDGRNEPYATPMAADPPVQAFSRSSTPEVVGTPVAIEDASDDPPTESGEAIEANNNQIYHIVFNLVPIQNRDTGTPCCAWCRKLCKSLMLAMPCIIFGGGIAAAILAT